jgi:hypothetical protein
VLANLVLTFPYQGREPDGDLAVLVAELERGELKRPPAHRGS